MAPARNTQVHLMPLRERCVAPRSLAAIPTPTAEKFVRSNRLWKTKGRLNTALLDKLVENQSHSYYLLKLGGSFSDFETSTDRTLAGKHSLISQLARELMKRVGLELHITSQTDSPYFVLFNVEDANGKIKAKEKTLEYEL